MSFYYSLFTFSWPRFVSGSLHIGGMLILRIYMYFAVGGMPIEMYGEAGSQACWLATMSCCIWLDSERCEESNGTYCAFMV